MFRSSKTSSDSSQTDHNQSTLAPADYERIGRSIESVVVAGHSSKRRLFWFNFLRGVFFGIGSAIGATLIIATSLYLLSLFSELPWVGDLFESIRNTVENANNSVNN